MATVSNYNPNDPNNQQQGQQEPQGQTQQNQPQSQQLTSGTQGAYSSAPNAASGSSPAPTKSGQFTNLNAYLKANQGFNQQQGGLAGSMNQQFQNQQNQIQQNVGGAQNQFNQQANQARNPYTNYNQYYGNQQSQQNQPQGNQPQGYQQFLNTVMSDPNAAVNNPEMLKQYQAAQGAQYTGPTQLDPNAQLTQQAQNYQQQAKQAQTEAGRFGLLNQMFYNPGYSQGQQSLDNLFLQGNPAQTSQLQTTQTGANRLVGNLNQAINQAGSAATGYGQEAQDISNAAKTALSGTATGLDTSLANAANTWNTSRDTDYQKALELAQQGQISQADLQNLMGGRKTAGQLASNPQLNLEAGGQLWGTNLADYLSKNNLNATKQSIATPEDYSKMTALQTLAGNALPTDLSKTFAEYGDKSLAGSAPTNKYGFDLNKLNTDIAANQSKFKNESAPFQSEINQAKTALGTDQDKFNNYLNQFKSTLASNNPNTNFLMQANPTGVQQIFEKSGITNPGLTNPNFNDSYKQALQKISTKDLMNITNTNPFFSQFMNPMNISVQQGPTTSDSSMVGSPYASPGLDYRNAFGGQASGANNLNYQNFNEYAKTPLGALYDQTLYEQNKQSVNQSAIDNLMKSLGYGNTLGVVGDTGQVTGGATSTTGPSLVGRH